MNEPLIRKANLFGAWCGVYYCVLMGVGLLVVAGFFPLHNPSAGADEIAKIFRDDAVRIRVGMVIMMWGSAFFIFWTAAAADFVSRIEGRCGPMTHWVNMGGYSNTIFTFFPAMYWIVNTYRADERSADMIQMLNDFAWIQFLGNVSLTGPMFVAIAVAALNDKSADPVFPRWVAYVTVWSLLLIVPDQLLSFFKSGPFAWNGIFSFWVPVTAFCAWFLMLSWLMRRKILREAELTNGFTAR